MAALLTELCDGSRTLAELRGLAGPLLPEGSLDEIDRWVDQGLKAGLLVEEGSDSDGGKELSAEELLQLTKRLREQGKVQTAYLCGKRTVELRPDNWTAWYDVGEIAQCLGKREEAREAYQKYWDANPGDGEIEHLLIALRDGPPPARASDHAIQHIYKHFAESYESRMLEDLKYVGPERLQEAITAVIGDRGGLEVLDIGCGSGLEGVNIRPRAASLTGIDLSPEMIALARARNIYDRLEVAEITSWLEQGQALFDLIVSCDCLIYFGDLRPVAEAAKGRLKAGGIFAFSMERSDKPPYLLTDTGRYAHHPDHVRETAAASGMELAYLNDGFLRFEYGVEVMGLYAVLSKAG
jgi:predicted TPR repeat methyltransferase